MAMKKRQSNPKEREEREFDQRVIDLARVTRVMAGGKRMRFRACVAIGDHKGRCGIGLAKGADVTIAINKAVNKAKKNLIRVPLVNETIPHRIEAKFGAAKILLKPAPLGTGIKCGGAVRMVLALAGVPNISGKILGGNNKINNVNALIKALSSFKIVVRKERTAKDKLPKKDQENK
jgi:small subunit ribosomal protein S5